MPQSKGAEEPLVTSKKINISSWACITASRFIKCEVCEIKAWGHLEEWMADCGVSFHCNRHRQIYGTWNISNQIKHKIQVEIQMHLWDPCEPVANIEAPCACKPKCEPTWKKQNCELTWTVFSEHTDFKKGKNAIFFFIFLVVGSTKFSQTICHQMVLSHLGARWGVEKRKMAETM